MADLSPELFYFPGQYSISNQASTQASLLPLLLIPGTNLQKRNWKTIYTAQVRDKLDGTRNVKDMDGSWKMDRRRFLRMGGLSVLGGMFLSQQMIPSSAIASTISESGATERKLFLLNTHTGESFNNVYYSSGSYNPQALSDINKVLRDHRTGDIHSIDPALLDQLSAMAKQLDVAPEFHIISGFRSPKTNTALRKKGSRVARKSYHLLGQAVDIRLPGTNTKTLYKTALSLGQGGVGRYGSFIHVDTGPVRHW